MASTPSNNRPGINKTPSRTPSSARHLVHTPLDRTAPRDLLNSVRNTSARRQNNAPTPHAKAARRALNDRRMAMFTPGKNRRRSMINQRETPMGILRNLGKALAPKSKAISSSSSSSPPDRIPRSSTRKSMREEYEDDDDDELPIDRPRLSLPIDRDDDDDEEELRPPRLSGVVDDDNYTMQSIELPRRQETGSRLSRGSFGRVSDFYNPDEETRDLGRDSDFFPGLLEDLQARAADDVEYERIDEDPIRRTTLGRGSDFGLEMPVGLEDHTDFFLDEPGGDATQTSPNLDQSLVEATANDAMEPMDDFSDREPMEDIPDRESSGELSDRDPIESVTNRSDESGLQVKDDGFRARVDFSNPGEVEEVVGDVTRTTNLPETRRSPEIRGKARPVKKTRISQHGIEYPSLPPAFVKRVAQTALHSSGLSNSRMSPDTLAALTQASEWFFEQLGDDLGAYAQHAKRKTIEESDIITLMRRQRHIGSSATMFSLAQKHLPRELLQELRMPPPQLIKQSRAKRQRDKAANEVT